MTMAVVHRSSALDTALERVGDRWVLLLVEALLGGPRRFNQLQDDVVGIASNTLSARLKLLEREGIVVARPYSARPPRFTYQLTGKGSELAGVLRMLAHWGAGTGDAEPVAHGSCGRALEARWYCPTCARLVETGPDEQLTYL